VIFFAIAMYVLLCFFFIVDVLRQQSLSGVGKALWIIAVLVAPVLSWIVYGFWRMRQDRGLPGF
jgi:hypothetical protein